jgi:nucleotide-binding universal stress UspA family protein
MIEHRDRPRPLTARERQCSFPRVIAAIDFSAASLGAARWGVANVAARADAIVCHVVPSAMDSSGENGTDRLQAARRHGGTTALLGGLGGFGATLDAASVRSIVRSGRASDWLTDLATESGADLLILGRRSDASRRGIGEPNVLERSARRTEATVLVVPQGTTEPPRHIVAAIDRSDVAHRVLAHARALVQQHACALTVVHVVCPTTESYDRVRRARRGRAAGPPRLQSPHVATPIEASDLHLLTGDPAREIILHAEHNGPALIVVGKRGADGAPPESIGSVARELLTRASSPVLAIGD